MVEIISAIEIVNCDITKPFLNNIPFVPVANLPFSTVTGLKEDSTSAG